MAIRPQDQDAYVEQLNAVDGDAARAYTNWMASERGKTPDEIMHEDAMLTTEKNPFDANRDPTAVSRGAVIFKLHCARCHGNDARGRGPSVLPDHPATDFKTFGKRFAATLHGGAPHKWFGVIRDGSGDVVTYPDQTTTAMPPFGDKMTREQIWLAITYLQSLDMYLKVDDAIGRDEAAQ